MAGFASAIYKQVHLLLNPVLDDEANSEGISAIFRRNQTFLGVIFVSAFAFEMAFDTTADRIWDYVNKGRQWKDIKYRYMQGNDDEEE